MIDIHFISIKISITYQLPISSFTETMFLNPLHPIQNIQKHLNTSFCGTIPVTSPDALTTGKHPILFFNIFCVAYSINSFSSTKMTFLPSQYLQSFLTTNNLIHIYLNLSHSLYLNLKSYPL